MKKGDVVGGKYRVERVLGRGGMGCVVAAVHEQLGQRVAMKFLLPEVTERADAVERFLREARAAVQLRSEHIGRVIDVDTLDSGAPYIVMEYLEGTDLENELSRRKRLPPTEAVDYVLQACEGLAEAHSIGLVHRDIKPANLFLTKRVDGTPLIKLLDFGIAKAAPDDVSFSLTKTQTLMGSPIYMSPEQLRSSRQADARSDIWSLGVVLYELVAGSPPFLGETFSELCIKIATEEPQGLSQLAADVHPELVSVIMRCLEKNPDKRFPHIASLASAMEPFGGSGRGVAVRLSRVLHVSAEPASESVVTPRSGAHATTLQSAVGERGDAPKTSPRRWLVGGGVAAVAGAGIVAAAIFAGRTSSIPQKASGGAAPLVQGSAVPAKDASPTRAQTIPTGVVPADAAVPQATAIAADAGDSKAPAPSKADGSAERSEFSEKEVGGDSTVAAKRKSPAVTEKRPRIKTGRANPSKAKHDAKSKGGGNDGGNRSSGALIDGTKPPVKSATPSELDLDVRR